MFNAYQPRLGQERFDGATYTQHSPLVPDGKVVEHWDVLQRVPTEFAHSNGLF